MALKKICQAPGCNCLVGPGERYCEKHRKPEESERRPFVGWMSDQQKAFYNSRRWRSLKADVLKENPVCQMCGINPSEECHHQYPIGQDFHNAEDFFCKERIICLCRECHQAVTRQRINEVKKRNRERKQGRLWY